MIRSPCPPARLVALLNDPAVLAKMIPAKSEIRQVAPGEFAFTVRRAFGPLMVNMPGTLTLVPEAAEHDLSLTAHAAHMIGGKVDITLNIRLTPGPAGTVLTYDGQVAASGLANRLLGDNSERVQDALQSMFIRLKRLADAGLKLGARPQGKAAQKG